MELLGAALATLKGAPHTFPTEDNFEIARNIPAKMAVGQGMK